MADAGHPTTATEPAKPSSVPGRSQRKANRRKRDRKQTRARKPERRTVSVRLELPLLKRVQMLATRAALQAGGRGPLISFSDALNDVLWQAFGPESSWYCVHGQVSGACGRCDMEGR